VRNAIISQLENELIKKEPGEFEVGDTVAVHQRIIESGKERVQVFTGTVIARKGKGVSETFSVHRVAYGEGMERVFLLHSPRIQRIEVTRQGKVRRAKLYFLRGTSGKKSKVKEFIGGRSKTKGKKPVAKAPVVAEEKASQPEA
jgi:large subunit ribosomal protein L19